MTEQEFEVLLQEAILRDVTETCAALPAEQELCVLFPDTSILDAKTEPLLCEGPPRRSPKARPWQRIGRMAAMLLLSLGLLFGLVMTNAEAREFVKRMLFEVFLDHNEYSFPVQNTTPLREGWEIGYVPEGFVPFLQELSDSKFLFKFERTDGALLKISISNASGKIYKDNEHYKMEKRSIRGELADVYYPLDSISPSMIVLYSEKQGVVFNLVGDLPIEELILILENITP